MPARYGIHRREQRFPPICAWKGWHSSDFHRRARVGRDLWRAPGPTPCSDRDNWRRLPMTTSRWLLNILKEESPQPLWQPTPVLYHPSFWEGPCWGSLWINNCILKVHLKCTPTPFSKKCHPMSSASFISAVITQRFLCCNIPDYLQVPAIIPWDTTTAQGRCHHAEPFHFINLTENPGKKKKKKYLKICQVSKLNQLKTSPEICQNCQKGRKAGQRKKR